MLFSIAWKNVWRNKLRSLIVILAIAVGLFGGLFYLGFSNGMAQHQINSGIKTFISNIQIHNPKYLINNDTKYDIASPGKVIKKIKSIKHVKAVTSRIKASAMISSAATGTGVMISGIDIDKERKVTDLYNKLIAGDYFVTHLRNPILIGQKLAEKLKVKVKSKVVITIQDMTGNITYGAFKVVGIFKTENTNFDLGNVYVIKNRLSNLIGLDKKKVSEIAVLLDHNDFTKQVTEELKHIFASEINSGNLTVRSWDQIDPILRMLNNMTIQFSMIFVTIILVALSFGIINTMLMAIMERVREIGMLMAIGMNRLKIFLMIMLETVFLSVTGGIIGLALSWAAIAITNKTGIDLSVVAKGLNSLGYSSFVHPELGMMYYLLIGLLVILTAIVASIFPARKALKLNPAEAVRQDV